MAPGDVFELEVAPDVYYVDTGMYETAEYGAVYIIDAERPAILDTGIGTHRERVFAAIESVGLAVEDLEVIAPTHVHLDHAGGAGFLAEEAPEATVFVHEIGAPHLVDPERLVEGTKRAVGNQWQYYVEPAPIPEDRVVALTQGDTIDLGDRELDVYHAPGHAPHQVVFHEAEAAWVHVADAAGIWVPSRGFVRETSPPPNFDLEKALEDVETIRELDPETLLYPHFGPVTAVEAVLEDYRDTLTGWVEDIAARLQAAEGTRSADGDGFSDETVESVVEHFVAANDMESVWGEVKAREETAMNVRGVVHYLKGAGSV